VHVRSGNAEGDGSGTGNLIVGWDNAPEDGAVRSGSNNLVAGDFNNFTSYAGFVVGIANSLSNCYSSVSGGANNVASVQYSSISGGFGNAASGMYSSVSGGFGLTESTQFGWMAGSYQTP
jgi:hypothetical protein